MSPQFAERNGVDIDEVANALERVCSILNRCIPNATSAKVTND
jgi:hypothetical protein